ncbi:hypothetical protein J8273_3282 [Carpediemonas membranifera]|uniref:Uncharacterized protein n=1 Tax=Carpediemonas membranifera TaxID=201153 RepID=A0A8J6B0U1_9EUKA|nr:hypothetical protein J8273_3282 [Carpediemonas membranifera]|eukprot:KAG9393153.1 hypothetical protein J8273_3282 [Carpediemonas membranifera]
MRPKFNPVLSPIGEESLMLTPDSALTPRYTTEELKNFAGETPMETPIIQLLEDATKTEPPTPHTATPDVRSTRTPLAPLTHPSSIVEPESEAEDIVPLDDLGLAVSPAQPMGDETVVLSLIAEGTPSELVEEEDELSDSESDASEETDSSNMTSTESISESEQEDSAIDPSEIMQPDPAVLTPIARSLEESPDSTLNVSLEAQPQNITPALLTTPSTLTPPLTESVVESPPPTDPRLDRLAGLEDEEAASDLDEMDDLDVTVEIVDADDEGEVPEDEAMLEPTPGMVQSPGPEFGQEAVFDFNSQPAPTPTLVPLTPSDAEPQSDHKEQSNDEPELEAIAWPVREVLIDRDVYETDSEAPSPAPEHDLQYMAVRELAPTLLQLYDTQFRVVRRTKHVSRELGKARRKRVRPSKRKKGRGTTYRVKGRRAR